VACFEVLNSEVKMTKSWQHVLGELGKEKNKWAFNPY